MSKNVDICVELKRESERAVQVNDGDEDIWLPKSQIEYVGEVGQTVTVTMPEWLAKEKGLI